MSFDNLLGGPEPVLLPPDPAAAELDGGEPQAVARQYPASSLAWAVLAEQQMAAGEDLTSYAFARVGYHRGLAALAAASDSIGDTAEAVRCRELLQDCDPTCPLL
jgi:Protein of unknown function (DUF3151)